MSPIKTQAVAAKRDVRLQPQFQKLPKRRVQAFWYVLPVILKSGKRPVIFSRFHAMGDIICTIPVVLEKVCSILKDKGLREDSLVLIHPGPGPFFLQS